MPPATPRPAASLVLLRNTADGPEVLVGRRSAAAPAFPGAWVFPGGKVEPGDAEAEARAGFDPDGSPAPPGAAYAALRETFEETGLWLAENGTGARFPEAPGFGRLKAYAHWITPERNPYRFDTWFFLALATAAEAYAPLFGDEFDALAWRRPAGILEDHADALLLPTKQSVMRLARHGSVAAIFKEAGFAGPFDAEGSPERLTDVPSSALPPPQGFPCETR